MTTYFISYMESSKIDIDILYMITYMNSISTADISRDEIFRRVSERKRIRLLQVYETGLHAREELEL